MRIALSAGHGGKDPGAVNPRLNLREHDVAARIVRELARMIDADALLVLIGEYTLQQKIALVSAAHRQQPFDLAIEVHLNAVASPQAHGTEVLYWSEAGKPIAQAVSKAISESLGTRNRGAKKPPGSTTWVRQRACPAILVEVLFISNDQEAAKILSPGFHSKVAQAICNGLVDFKALRK